MVSTKAQIEASLFQDNKDIRAGKLKEDSPLDLSDDFNKLCQACRLGDLKICQEKILEGVNINARDEFDYTPLVLVCYVEHEYIVEKGIDS
jgi:ankyrin repeat and BTB/POZ domain-containing protein 1